MSIAQNFPNIQPTLNLSFALTKALDPRITYTRATTATYYDGKTTALAEQNLLLRSQEIATSPWASINVVTTNNTTVAPDGTTTASTIAENLTLNLHAIQQNGPTINGTYTLSVYLKYNTAQFFQLTAWSSTSQFAAACFDLITNTFTTASGSGYSSISATMTASTNGFYRCTLTYTTIFASAYGFGFNNTATASWFPTYLGTGSTVFAWGAQLEQRSSVTAYTPTTTAPITNYIPVLLTAASGVARFQHNPTTGESLGLLVEEQRTNLVTYSEQFDNAVWVKTNVTVTSNQIVAPDGTITADNLVENTANGTHQIAFLITQSNNQTFSIAAKLSSGTRTLFINQGGRRSAFELTGVGSVILQGGSGTTGTASISSIGNGWYRCSVTLVSSVQTNQVIVGLSQASGGTFGESYTGDGTSGIYIWGAQLEAGAFATSYIKTEASQITRANDSASMTGANFSSWFNQSEGTMYSLASTFRTSGYGEIFQIATDNANRIDIGLIGISGYISMQNNNVENAAWSNGDVINVNKYANQAFVLSSIAYKTNDTVAAVNGVAGATDINCIVPLLNSARIGYDQLNRYLNGTIKKISYYPIRIQNSQLQGLTT